MIGRLVAAVGLGAAAVTARRRLTDWGATAQEITAVLPGDELVSDPADNTTCAVGIEAPAAEVWRWLVQIGQGRGGMYSYQLMENLIGLDIHNTDEIRDEWQHLAVGDRIVLVPAGRLGLADGYALPVARLVPGRAIVLRQCPPEHPWNAVWSFVIVPEGPLRCRLLSRGRAARPASVLLRFATGAMAPITLLMTRRMLLGIKRRAERSAAAAAPPGTRATTQPADPCRPSSAGSRGAAATASGGTADRFERSGEP